MSVDRLQELRRKKGRHPSSAHKVGAHQPTHEDGLLFCADSKGATIEMQTLSTSPKDWKEDFISLYGPINAFIDEINKGTEEMHRLRVKNMKASDDNSHRKIQSEMATLTAKLTQLALETKQHLAEIKALNDQLDLEEKSQNTVHGQIRLNLYQTTCQRFQQASAGFSEARDAFKVAVEERMARSIMIIDPEVTKDQALAMVDAGKAEHIIIKGLASDNLREVCVDLRTRHQELMYLQNNVEALLIMFRELHYMIELNGESINLVDQRISRARDYVEAGEEKVKKANHDKSTSMIWLICLVFGLLCVAVIVLTPILITAEVGKKPAAGGE